MRSWDTILSQSGILKLSQIRVNCIVCCILGVTAIQEVAGSARTALLSILWTRRHMGGCQDYGPFLGPYYNTAPIL